MQARSSDADRSEAKTILFVNSSGAFYGAERSLLEVVSLLGTRWKARFVVPERGRYSSALEIAKYPYDVARVPANLVRTRVRDLRCILRLAWIIRARRARLVHANLQWVVPLVAASSRLAGVPFVAHLRNMVTSPVDARWAESFRHASAIICISHAVRDSACEAGLLSPEHCDRTCIIPDGRDLSNYSHGDRARIRAELGIGPDVPLVGMIAQIHPLKGQHRFLEMAALVAERMPAVHFIIVGDPLRKRHSEYLSELRHRCECPLLKHRVTFLGYRSDIPDLLAALDCFVHPSERGAFVSVLIEAMALGVPIVVPEVDGIPECVGRDGAAELIECLQPAAFANAVVKILREPTRRTRMSLAGRERAKRYDAVLMARETERVFDSCL